MIIKPKAALWKNNLISGLSEPRTRTKRKYWKEKNRLIADDKHISC